MTEGGREVKDWEIKLIVLDFCSLNHGVNKMQLFEDMVDYVK